MTRALLALMIGALGCQPEMNDMMEGGPVDGGWRPPDADMGDGGLPLDMEAPDAEAPDVEAPDVAPPEPDASADALRINHLQMRGTVNSYHTVDHDENPELMGYVHRPLDEQAAQQGIRVFDFDIVPDRVAGIGLEPAVTDLGVDDLSHCGDWLRCLYQLDDWMDAHPRHPLVVVLVGEARLYYNTRGLHFQLDDIERQIVTALGRGRILAPGQVRGFHPDLRTAVREGGWPTVDATRGLVMFILNERGLARTAYLNEGGEDPDDRLLFQIGDPTRAEDLTTRDEVIFTFEPDLHMEEHPWLFETDPADLEEIEALARSGYLVHGISDDPDMIDRLRAAGAHFIGSRYPDRFGPIPPEGPTTCNPVTGPADCDPTEIEPAP